MKNLMNKAKREYKESIILPFFYWKTYKNM